VRLPHRQAQPADRQRCRGRREAQFDVDAPVELVDALAVAGPAPGAVEAGGDAQRQYAGALDLDVGRAGPPGVVDDDAVGDRGGLAVDRGQHEARQLAPARNDAVGEPLGRRQRGAAPQEDRRAGLVDRFVAGLLAGGHEHDTSTRQRRRGRKSTRAHSPTGAVAAGIGTGVRRVRSR